MKLRKYKLGSRGLRIAVLADLHNKPWEGIVAQTRTLEPDLILIPGDLTFGFDGFDRVAGFVAACRDIAPTCLSLGNHDKPEVLRPLRGYFLDNGWMDVSVRGVELRIGGLSAPSSRMGIPARQQLNTAWLPEFCRTERYKILLCHQPEHYPAYLADKPVDLVVSGHAHGGQWRIPFTDRGIYAPGQGFMPRLTGGVVDGRLVISRGLSNSVWIPRFFNPREILLIEI